MHNLERSFFSRGLSPAKAELKFLEIAKRLEIYGSEVQKAKVNQI